MREQMTYDSALFEQVHHDGYFGQGRIRCAVFIFETGRRPAM